MLRQPQKHYFLRKTIFFVLHICIGLKSYKNIVIWIITWLWHINIRPLKTTQLSNTSTIQLFTYVWVNCYIQNIPCLMSVIYLSCHKLAQNDFLSLLINRTSLYELCQICMYILMKRDINAKLFLLCQICGFMCNYKSINNQRSRRNPVKPRASQSELSVNTTRRDLLSIQIDKYGTKN